MKLLLLLAILSLLNGCAVMPSAPLSHANARIDIPSGEFLFCTITAPDSQCSPNQSGLVASGLGGIFLPLDVKLTSIKMEDSHATVVLAVNDIPAHCSSGTSQGYPNPPTIAVSGVYCNWLGIGNVLASLRLIIDSISDENVYVGRYLIRFVGTGNGSGAGYFLARKAS